MCFMSYNNNNMSNVNNLFIRVYTKNIKNKTMYCNTIYNILMFYKSSAMLTER